MRDALERVGRHCVAALQLAARLIEDGLLGLEDPARCGGSVNSVHAADRFGGHVVDELQRRMVRSRAESDDCFDLSARGMPSPRRVGAGALDLPVTAAPLGMLLVFAVTLALVGLTSDRLALPLGLLNFAGFVVIAVVPDAGNVVAFTCAMLLAGGLVRTSLTLRRRVRSHARKNGS